MRTNMLVMYIVRKPQTPKKKTKNKNNKEKKKKNKITAINHTRSPEGGIEGKDNVPHFVAQHHKFGSSPSEVGKNPDLAENDGESKGWRDFPPLAYPPLVPSSPFTRCSVCRLSCALSLVNRLSPPHPPHSTPLPVPPCAAQATLPPTLFIVCIITL